ncbi:MAG: vitamin K epoxide reductase family protein [Desulfuromonadaceae bacterium]|nr:vitamin K epoxide reductase family protein [Desulfuromonadaceae bacterium]
MRKLEAPFRTGYGRTISILLWCAVAIGWLVSIFSVIEEMCLATACRDSAAFTVLGINMGWFGISYFTLLLILLRQRKMNIRLDWLPAAMVFAGVGAELRLLWIQKYVIGRWCPLCVSICCALFCAAVLLLLEKKQETDADVTGKKNLMRWVVLQAVMIASGLLVAVLGVKALE